MKNYDVINQIGAIRLILTLAFGIQTYITEDTSLKFCYFNVTGYMFSKALVEMITQSDSYPRGILEIPFAIWGILNALSLEVVYTFHFTLDKMLILSICNMGIFYYLYKPSFNFDYPLLKAYLMINILTMITFYILGMPLTTRCIISGIFFTIFLLCYGGKTIKQHLDKHLYFFFNHLIHFIMMYEVSDYSLVDIILIITFLVIFLSGSIKEHTVDNHKYEVLANILQVALYYSLPYGRTNNYIILYIGALGNVFFSYCWWYIRIQNR